MAKQLKKIVCSHYENKFGDMGGSVLIDYRGLNSEQTRDLRASLHKGAITMNIVQNRLAKRVFAKAGAPTQFQDLLRGPTAVLVGDDGAISASRVIVQWRKKNKDLAKIKGGLLEGKTLSVAEVEKLANLPDVATLQSRLCGLFMAPATHLVTAIQSLLSHFAGAVKAHRESLEKGAEAPKGG